MVFPGQTKPSGEARSMKEEEEAVDQKKENEKLIGLRGLLG